jgi:hypothetical protein
LLTLEVVVLEVGGVQGGMESMSILVVVHMVLWTLGRIPGHMGVRGGHAYGWWVLLASQNLF